MERSPNLADFVRARVSHLFTGKKCRPLTPHQSRDDFLDQLVIPRAGLVIFSLAVRISAVIFAGSKLSHFLGGECGGQVPSGGRTTDSPVVGSDYNGMASSVYALYRRQAQRNAQL